MELQIVRFIQGWSCKALDVIMGIINMFGEDLFFYMVFFALYWMYSKSFAFKYMFVYLTTCGFNKIFKTLVKRPRPAGSTESGYSFPSGHAMSYAGASTQLVYELVRNGQPKKKWQKADMWIEYILFGLLVALARMYFGAHYLTDVIAGLILGAYIATSVTYILNWLLEKIKGKINFEIVLAVLAPIVLVAYIVVATTGIISTPDTLEKVYRFAGIFMAVAVGYFIDKKFIKYDAKDEPLKEKIVKVGVGLGLLTTFYILFLSQKPVDFMLTIYYFATALVATTVFPWVFKTINQKPEDVSGAKKDE